MSNILKSIGRDAVAVEQWLAKAFQDVEKDIAPVLVSAIEAIRNAEAGGILPAIAKALDPYTKGLATEINNKIIAGIPTALSIALAIEGLPANATPAQLETWENSVIAAIAGKEAEVKGSAYTKTVTEFYILIQATIASPGGATVGKVLVDVEEAYQDLQQNIADAAAGVDDSGN